MMLKQQQKPFCINEKQPEKEKTKDPEKTKKRPKTRGRFIKDQRPE